MTITGSVFLRSLKDESQLDHEERFQANALVCLTGSKLGMDLVCTDGHFKSDKLCASEGDISCAIEASNMSIGGNVTMEGVDFRVEGGIQLNHTQIRGFLNFEKGTINASIDRVGECFAIAAGKLQVGGSIYLKEFTANGEVGFNDASIGRNLVFTKGNIINEGGFTLSANQMKVAGSVRMVKFTSHGEVNIDRSEVGGNLDCSGSTFVNNKPKTESRKKRISPDEDENRYYALRAIGAKIEGCVWFDNKFSVEGVISLQGAQIGRSFLWKGIVDAKTVSLFLDTAKVGILADDSDSWPVKEKNDQSQKSMLQINDLEYLFLRDEIPEEFYKRINVWLRLPDKFRTQPYYHLAAVLKRSGYEEVAKLILIEKNKRQTDLIPNPFLKLLRMFFYGGLIDYGYKPIKALWYGLVFIVLGCLFFVLGFHYNHMVPSKDNRGVDFYQVAIAEDINDTKRLKGDLDIFLYSIVYSIDTFLPVVDLQTAEYWLPTAYSPLNKELNGWGLALCLWRWLSIGAGWVITSFFVAALSGLVRR